MVKEETITGCVVREPVCGGMLSFFRKKPNKIRSNKWADVDGNRGSTLADYKNDIFKDIKTEAGPVMIELTIKILQNYTL